jgi:hypothetical protein
MLRVKHSCEFIIRKSTHSNKAQPAITEHCMRPDEHSSCGSHRRFSSDTRVGRSTPNWRRTTVLPVRDEIEDQTEADDIPSLTMPTLIHAQKILFQDGRMARVQVDGRHVYPRRASTIIVRLDGTDLE